MAQSLGEIAYVAYWRVLAPLHLPWRRLHDDERRAWEAAARAAVAQTRRQRQRLARRQGKGSQHPPPHRSEAV